MVNVGLRREMYETEVEYKRGGGRKLEGQIKKKRGRRSRWFNEERNKERIKAAKNIFLQL